MPSYLRQSSSGRTILVRPSFYERNGWKESAPYDCLDLIERVVPGAARYRCDHDDYLPPATLEKFLA